MVLHRSFEAQRDEPASDAADPAAEEELAGAVLVGGAASVEALASPDGAALSACAGSGTGAGAAGVAADEGVALAGRSAAGVAVPQPSSTSRPRVIPTPPRSVSEPSGRPWQVMGGD